MDSLYPIEVLTLDMELDQLTLKEQKTSNLIDDHSSKYKSNL